MSEFEEKLGAILGDAQAMDQIMALAQSLSGRSGGETGAAAASVEGDIPDCPLPAGEPGRDARLLSALRPYLKPERQVKIDRTLEMLSMIRMIRSLK